MIPALVLLAASRQAPVETVAGFFVSERQCMPFEGKHDCGCKAKTSPRYFIDDTQGHRREILLDAARVASYGGPERLEGKWVSARGTVENERAGKFRMRDFGVLTPGVLKSALERGDETALADVPDRARAAILRSAPTRRELRLQSAGTAKPYLTVLCRTSDTTAVTPRPAVDYTTNMKSTFPGFDHFVRNMSYGTWNAEGSQTVGWIDLPKAKAAYLSPWEVNGKPLWDSQKLMPDIVAMLDPTIDFSKFAGINVFMNTNDESGVAYATSYFMTVDGLNGWLPMTEDGAGLSQSILGHEDGHNFGLDHSSGAYNDPYDSQWDVMSGGNHWITDPTLGGIAVSNGYNAYHRYKNGWIGKARIVFGMPGDVKTFHLERLTDPTNEGDPLMAKLFIGGSARHYYTVEARKPVGYDVTVPNAVVIHDVVESRTVSDPWSIAPRFDRSAQVVDPDGNGNPNDAAAQWRPGETYQDAPNGIKVEILSEDATGFNVRVTIAADQPLPGVVWSGKDDGPGTLRDWFWYRQDFPTAPLRFKIPTTDASYVAEKGYFRIKLKTPLPELTAADTVLDGASQTAFAGDTNPKGPEIMIDGADAGQWASGLVLKGANQAVRNLAIGNFKATGIRVEGATGASIQNCYLGVEPDGLTPAPNAWEGVSVVAKSVGLTIGGANAGNLISGNTGYGVSVWDAGTVGTTILGNRIGTDRTGTVAVANGYDGISVRRDSSGTTIGSALAGNLISGNGSQGVYVGGANGTRILGNRIGTNDAGDATIPNRYWGIAVRESSDDTVIGGPGVGAGNLVSGNSTGIGAGDATVTRVVVEGNRVGTNAAGTAKLGNVVGVYVFGGARDVAVRGNLLSGNEYEGLGVVDAGTGEVVASGNLIGTNLAGTAAVPNTNSGVWVGQGATATLRDNVIGGNGSSGVSMSGAKDCVVEANLIGTDTTGAVALSNGSHGVYLGGGSTGNRIGGGAGRENVIAGNLAEGVVVADAGTTANRVSGNLIGVTRTGAAMGNAYNGVWVGNGATDNAIGDPAAPNTIGSNGHTGVGLGQAGTARNAVRNNWIGLLPGGDARPNGYEGVSLWGGASNNAIGGVAAGEGNAIANNGYGVAVYDATSVGNTIRGNRISNNRYLGIQLAADDGPNNVTANDALDADAGPNGLQNFPSLTRATRGGASLTLEGSFLGAPNAQVTLDFYGSAAADASGYGEGATLLGSKTVATDANGTANFSMVLPGSDDAFVTATATGPDGSTSEFSSSLAVLNGLDSLSVAPSSIRGGKSATGTVRLVGPAKSGGTVVTLSVSNASLATVPFNVTVPAGATSAAFAVTTKPVASAATVTISAVLAGVTKQAALEVLPPIASKLEVSPSSAVGGTTLGATLTLDGAAPLGGATVALSVDLPAAASVPASVQVPAGGTTATFSIATLPVARDTVVTARADLNGAVVSGAFTLLAARPVSVTFTPPSVLGGTSSVGSVAISGAARVGGVIVALASEAPEVTVPASVTVPAGARSATFVAVTRPVASNLTATVGATANGDRATGTLQVRAPRPLSLTLAPTRVAGGSAATGTVTLDGPSPAGGTTVVLSSDAAEAVVPTSVTVAADATTATFAVATQPVGAEKTAKVTAVAGGATVSATLTLLAPEASDLTFVPNPVMGGENGTGTVTISSAAPAGGAFVVLSSGEATVVVPGGVAVKAGETQATFVFRTLAVSRERVVSVTATYGGRSVVRGLTVKSRGLLSLEFLPNPVQSGAPSTGKVTMAGTAEAGGVVVTLSTSSPLVSLPATVRIPAGQSSATFVAATVSAVTSGEAPVTASALNSTVGATLKVLGISPVSVVFSPVSVVGGTGTKATVTLSLPAPSGGMKVALTSNSPCLALPATATVPAGARAVVVAATTVAVPSDVTAVATASANGGSASGSVDVLAPKIVLFTVSPATVVGGKPSTGTVGISSAAPKAGLTIALSSGGPAVVVPGTVVIAGGKTSGTFVASTLPVASDRTETLRALLNGAMTTASLRVTSPILTGLTLKTAAVKGGTALTGTVALSDVAPAGGVVVTLTSNSPACDGGSVRVPAGALSAAFSLPTRPVGDDVSFALDATLGSVTLRANAKILAPVATLEVNPTKITSKLPAVGTIRLDGPAPQGYVWSVTTTSVLDAPASVAFSPGATTATFGVTAERVVKATTGTVTVQRGAKTLSVKLTVSP